MSSGQRRGYHLKFLRRGIFDLSTGGTRSRRVVSVARANDGACRMNRGVLPWRVTVVTADADPDPPDFQMVRDSAPSSGLTDAGRNRRGTVGP